jgi:hypothetical protein
LTALALAALILPAAAHAKPTGFQLEVQGLGAQPAWSGSRSAVNFGGGSGARMLFGFSRTVSLGVSVAYVKNVREYAYAGALPGPPVGGVSAPRTRRTILGGPGRRSLSTLPVEIVGQLRSSRPGPINGYIELGGGITNSVAKVQITRYQSAGSDTSAASRFLLPVASVSNSAVQQSPSVIAGVGAILALGRNWELVGTLDWHQAFASGGKVWESGDSPRFVTFGAGIRYPRY